MSHSRDLSAFAHLQDNGQTAMREAFKSKDVANIIYLLQLGADPNGTCLAKKFENEPFLLKAAAEQNATVLASLIKHGARVSNAITIAYINFHFYQAYHKDTYQQIIKTLLDWAPGVNFYNSPLELNLTKFHGVYPGGLCFLNDLNIHGFNFIGVAKAGKPITRLDIAEFHEYKKALLKFDDINQIEDPARKKSLSKRVRECIISNGLSIHQGILNLVPLHRAAEIGDQATVEIRLAAKVNPNYPTYMPPVFLAAANEHFHIMKLLLEKANIEFSGIILALKTLLQKNNAMNFKENIILLIEYAKKSSKLTDECWYEELLFFILQYFHTSTLKENEKISQIISLWSLLKDHGAKFNVKNEQGEPLLNFCIKYQAKSKNLDLITYLLENDCDYRMTNNERHGPLYIAAQYNFKAASEKLLEIRIGTPKKNPICSTPSELLKKSNSDSQLLLLRHNPGLFVSGLIQKRKNEIAKKNTETHSLTPSLSPRSKLDH